MAIRTVLHEFRMGDNDDPEIYAAQPIWEWQQTEAGKWCMKNCVPESISWGLGVDPYNYGYKVHVYGDMTEPDLTYYLVKYRRFDKNWNMASTSMAQYKNIVGRCVWWASISH